MKILKHGDLHPRIFKCLYCNCEFVADMSEYKPELSECGACYYVGCPCCNNYDLHPRYNCELYDGEYMESASMMVTI